MVKPWSERSCAQAVLSRQGSGDARSKHQVWATLLPLFLFLRPCGFVVDSNNKLNVQRSITKSRPLAKISFARIPTKWSINRFARISNYNRDRAE